MINVSTAFKNTIDLEAHKKAYIGDHREYRAALRKASSPENTSIPALIFTMRRAILSLLSKAEELVECIIKNQHDDGYLGGYPKEDEWQKFSVWNQTFTVCGLMSYYKATKRKRALAAAEKCSKNIAFHYMAEKDDIMDAFNDGTQNAFVSFNASGAL